MSTNPKDEDEVFRKEYESTIAAMSIARTYGHQAEKKLGKVMMRLGCDMFQAAARHTGLIERMTHYWSANSGRWMVHIPSMVKASHGIVHWNWNDRDECDVCLDKHLCYDNYLKAKKEARNVH